MGRRWAPYSVAPFVQNAGVNHGRADVLLPKTFVYHSDVVTGFVELSREGMPQGVAADMFADISHLTDPN